MHRIESLFLLDQPLRGAEGAAGEGFAAVGTVDELDSLAQAAEDDSVLPDDVPGADGQQADLLLGSFADNPFTAADTRFVQISIQRLSHSPTQCERRAARSILLEPVVRLDDFYVVIFAEGLSHSAQEAHEQIHAEAHVGRDKDASAARKLLDLV